MDGIFAHAPLARPIGREYQLSVPVEPAAGTASSFLRPGWTDGAIEIELTPLRRTNLAWTGEGQRRGNGANQSKVLEPAVSIPGHDNGTLDPCRC